MPIVIKEIRVRTTVERYPQEVRLPEETLAALKRNILKELAHKGRIRGSNIKKDR